MKKRTILLTLDDDQRLVKLADRQPFATPHAVARIALKLGLAQLEREGQLAISDAKAVTT